MNLINDIKAFLFDVDGTLINKQCVMSNNMYKTLKYLKDSGYYIVINSGRPVFSSRKVLEANKADDLFDYYYGCNGVEFYDKKQDKTTYISALSNELIKEYAKLFSENFISLGMYKDGKDLLINHTNLNPEKINIWGMTRFVNPIIYDFDTYTGEAPKLVFLFDNKDRKKVDEKIKSISDERVDIFYSGDECGEIVPKGTNKGVSVKEFAKLINISPKQIMCFGDAENDVPAILESTGVMMDYPLMNEKYGIKLSCDNVNNDGIYNFLKEYLPIE